MLLEVRSRVAERTGEDVNDEPIGLSREEMEAERNRLFSDIMQMNGEIVAAGREQIRRLEVIRDAYLLQADRIMDLIHLFTSGLVMTAEATGDLLLAEFGLAKVDPNDDIEEDLEDEDD